MKISVHDPILSMIRFELNDQIVPHTFENRCYVADIEFAGTIKIFFEPWKIIPIVRIDGHLLDYWNADILKFDHMIQLRWDDQFYNRYQARIVDAKIEFLNLTTQEDIDKYVGINNLNPDLLESIKKILHDKKSSTG
jgi:hypothetical protein